MTDAFIGHVEIEPLAGVDIEGEPDRRRLRVYRAEDKAAANAPAPLLDGSLADAQRYVDRIVRSAWWRRTCPGAPITRVRVEATRGDSAWAYYTQAKIRLGRGSLRGCPTMAEPWIILHELAHLLAARDGHRGHGREFARYFLLIVQRWLGEDAARALREAYADEGVKYRARPKR